MSSRISLPSLPKVGLNEGPNTEVIRNQPMWDAEQEATVLTRGPSSLGRACASHAACGGLTCGASVSYAGTRGKRRIT